MKINEVQNYSMVILLIIIIFFSGCCMGEMRENRDLVISDFKTIKSVDNPVIGSASFSTTKYVSFNITNEGKDIAKNVNVKVVLCWAPSNPCINKTFKDIGDLLPSETKVITFNYDINLFEKAGNVNYLPHYEIKSCFNK